jgi:hypothetical protein
MIKNCNNIIDEKFKVWKENYEYTDLINSSGKKIKNGKIIYYLEDGTTIKCTKNLLKVGNVLCRIHNKCVYEYSHRIDIEECVKQDEKTIKLYYYDYSEFDEIYKEKSPKLFEKINNAMSKKNTKLYN